MFRFYAIRHKPTGHFLPQPKGKNGSGGSWVEPTDPKEEIPRLLVSERSAKGVLNAWLQGTFKASWDTDWDSGHRYVDDIKIQKKPNRIREDMEIVVIHLSVEDSQSEKPIHHHVDHCPTCYRISG